MSNITVLIPCLNEAKTTYSLIEDIKDKSFKEITQ